jgi:hypothetical protein
LTVLRDRKAEDQLERKKWGKKQALLHSYGKDSDDDMMMNWIQTKEMWEKLLNKQQR